MEWLHDVVCYSVSCNLIPFKVEWSLPLLCWLVPLIFVIGSLIFGLVSLIFVVGSLIFVVGSLMYCLCVDHWRSGEEGRRGEGRGGREDRGGERCRVNLSS